MSEIKDWHYCKTCHIKLIGKKVYCKYCEEHKDDEDFEGKK